MTPFSDEQLRLLANLGQRYDAWLSLEKEIATLPYGMRWKTSAGKEYLYRISDRDGNGISLGARSPETEAQLEAYRDRRDDLRGRLKTVRESLDEMGRLYRGLRLPLIPSEAAKILREADRRGILGDGIVVVGTNAMPAYSLEACGRLDAPDETQDFDLARRKRTADSSMSVWEMLKAVDPTYSVNTERDFQARNASHYEVDFLTAPSLVASGSRDIPNPLAMPSQEWLLFGNPISHVVVARDGSPARLVVPDPRWFALHKIWLSVQETRDSFKRRKDELQGKAVLNAVARFMPGYKLDEDFEARIPDELMPHYERWKAEAGEIISPSSTWK